MTAAKKVVVHCFFHCGHTTTGSSITAHDAMERHYRTNHRPQISAVLHRLQVQARKD